MKNFSIQSAVKSINAKLNRTERLNAKEIAELVAKIKTNIQRQIEVMDLKIGIIKRDLDKAKAKAIEFPIIYKDTHIVTKEDILNLEDQIAIAKLELAETKEVTSAMLEEDFLAAIENGANVGNIINILYADSENEEQDTTPEIQKLTYKLADLNEKLLNKKQDVVSRPAIHDEVAKLEADLAKAEKNLALINKGLAKISE